MQDVDCEEKAREMRRLADQTSGPIRAHYLELARGWEELAKKTALSSPSQPSGR